MSSDIYNVHVWITSSLSLSATKSGVVFGRTIIAGIFNCLATYAAAKPALPPEAQTI